MIFTMSFTKGSARNYHAYVTRILLFDWHNSDYLHRCIALQRGWLISKNDPKNFVSNQIVAYLQVSNGRSDFFGLENKLKHYRK